MSSWAPKLVYVLCLGGSLLCTGLLARAYRRTRHRLLLWCALSFAMFSLNNLLLVADLIVFPTHDLWVWRQASAGLAIAILLCGFIWEGE
jgi:CHASE2 domain-containing sensor protein